ncbi:ChaN family lipoprotein [Corallococcus sp. CA047B]|uniref:ChaN family lipoprotein n=1 Tax=Corallococcus sp. CA047B TaxID=2316729 RepID=UPI0011C49A0D|nr:ChaN family lipoprotein [Corallococcus sp. CA047B]
MRMSLGSLLAVPLILGGCRSARETPTAPVAQAAHTRVDCGPAIPGMEAVLKPAAFVVLGEIHGTQEAPAFAARLACHAASSGQPVRLALELPVAEQARLEAWFAKTDATAQQLTDSDFWRREVQDGRSSEAMKQLLEQVRDWRHAGLPLQVVAFDAGGKERDATMAEQLRQARSEARQDTFIVLVGNLHARRDVGAPWNPSLEFMTHRLLVSEPGLVSLDVARTAGSAWVCRGMTADTCGQQALRGVGTAQPVGVVLQKSVDDPDGYDGTWSVGAMSASPPALGASTATPAPQ